MRMILLFVRNNCVYELVAYQCCFKVYNYDNCVLENRPAQRMEHCDFCVDSPWHVAPPCGGGEGLEQVRDRRCTPWPHDTLHSLQSLHSDHFPFTTVNTTTIIIINKTYRQTVGRRQPSGDQQQRSGASSTRDHRQPRNLQNVIEFSPVGSELETIVHCIVWNVATC